MASNYNRAPGWRCPECGTLNSGNSSFCMGCGRRKPQPASGQGGSGRGGATGTSGGNALKSIAIVLACLLVAAGIGFGVSKILLNDKEPQPSRDDGTEQGYDDDTADTDSQDDTTPDDNDAGVAGDYRTAYAEVLRLNEPSIRDYDWQTDNEGNELTDNVLLYDLNGDDAPELLFFTADGNSNADLHVYTMSGADAVECYYDMGTDIRNNTDDGLLRDVYAASGTSFMVYTGKSTGTFYLAHYIGDTASNYYSVKCTMDDDGNIWAEEYVYNYVIEDGKEVDEYYIDGGDVSDEDGKKKFKEHREDYSDLLMCSRYTPVMKVFENLKTDRPAATDYDDVMSRLEI